MNQMFQINQNNIENRLGITLNRNKCPSKKGFYPNITPIIYSITPDSSQTNVFTTVKINGLNFLPFGSTQLDMGEYKNIPYSYLSSFNISFNVPYGIIPGTYDIQLSNIDSKNVIPNAVYSNIITYTIT